MDEVIDLISIGDDRELKIIEIFFFRGLDIVDCFF